MNIRLVFTYTRPGENNTRKKLNFIILYYDVIPLQKQYRKKLNVYYNFPDYIIHCQGRPYRVIFRGKGKKCNYNTGQ